MADYIIVDGDQAMFIPAFGPAIVVVQPGQISGSGKASLQGKMVCIDGDETSVEVPGCAYTAGAFSVPGTGTLKIAALGGDQVAQKTYSNGKPLILKGATFTAKFEVQSPAQMPPPASTPDGAPQYTGTGMFVTTNMKWRAT